jgi:nitroreductase
MDLHELILARRTVHKYLPETVPSDILERAIECAIHAPIHRLTFPWRFFRTGPETRAKIASWQNEFKRQKFLSGGELFILGVALSGKSETDEENYASMACAVQNMALYLWSVGYGSKWSTGAAAFDPRLYEILGAAPDQLRLCGFFWIGRAETVPDRPPRPPLENFYFTLP